MEYKQTIKIKPLSVNKAWQGRRFKTKAYKSFESEMLLKLKPVKISGVDTVKFVFGVSSRLSDIDNPLKLTLDCLCKKYDFDDRDIYRLEVTKEIVAKGDEFIEIEIL